MESTLLFGSCKFCGQQIDLDGGEYKDQEAADNAAAHACSCPSAQKMREAEREEKEREARRQDCINRANLEVIKLFVDSTETIGQPAYPEEIARMLFEAVEWVYDLKVKSITVNAIGKAKISRTAKGDIAIERSDGTSYRSIV